MKLTELQSKITPGKWQRTGPTTSTLKFDISTLDREHCRSSGGLVAMVKSRDDAAYLAHCAIHLPALAEALENLRDRFLLQKWESPKDREAYEVALSALAAAQEVQL